MNIKLLIAGILALVALAAAVEWYYASSMPKKSTISKEQARAIAEKKIPSVTALVDDQTQEHEFGWVFFYTTKKYLETNDVNDIIPGNGPLIVNRDGSVVQLSTAGSPERLIEEYKKANQ